MHTEAKKSCMHAFLMHCILKIDLVNQFAYIRCVEHCWMYLDSVSVVEKVLCADQLPAAVPRSAQRNHFCGNSKTNRMPSTIATAIFKVWNPRSEALAS